MLLGVALGRGATTCKLPSIRTNENQVVIFGQQRDTSPFTFITRSVDTQTLA
jgi:hypothetical protein